MTVIEKTAKDVEMAASFLGHFLTTTDPERLHWKPKAEGENSKTRSSMDVVTECVEVNLRAAATLSGRAFEWAEPSYQSAAEVQVALTESAAELAKAILQYGDSVFSTTFQMPWGEMQGGMIIALATANMHYHNGQINYIQCLYGDDVFHRPGRA